MGSKPSNIATGLKTIEPKQAYTDIIIIDRVKHSVLTVPSPESQLVKNSEKELLQSLSIQSVIDELDFAGELIFVAANALTGVPKIEGKVKGMQIELAELCLRCEGSMSMFASTTDTMIRQLNMAVIALYQLQEIQAMNLLKPCMLHAKKMSDESEKLAEAFKALQDTAKESLQDAIGERNKNQASVEKIDDSIEQLQADLEGNKTKGEAISRMAKRLELEHIEAKENLSAASGRELILGITQALTSAIAAGVAVYASTSPVGMAGKAVGTVNNAVNSARDNEEIEKKQKQKEEVDAEITEAQDSEANAQRDLEEAKGIEETATDNEAEAQSQLDDLKKKQKGKKKPSKADESKLKAAQKKLEKAQKALEEASADVAEKQTALDETKNDLKETRSKLLAVSAALNKISQSAEKMADSAHSSVEAYTKEKAQLLTAMIDAQEKEADVLGAVAKLAVQIKNANKSKNATETAVRTLTLGVRALGMIVSSLLQVTHFWRMMSDFCGRLGDKTITDNIKSMQKLDSELRKDFYYNDAFKTMMVSYMGRWVALHAICNEYKDRASQIAEKVNGHVSDEKSIKESRELAPQLAEKIMDRITLERAKISSQKTVAELRLNLMNADAGGESNPTEEINGEEGNEEVENEEDENTKDGEEDDLEESNEEEDNNDE